LLSCGVLAWVVWSPACSPDGGSSPELRQPPGIPAATEIEWRAIDPPAKPDSLAPNLAIVGGRLAATWLEESESQNSGSGHRLQFSRWVDGAWLAPTTIAEGQDFFANWADIPALIEANDGSLLAHWLAKTGGETYAYSILLARSTDQGLTWRPLGPLNDDMTPTEHGFVSWVTEGDAVRAFWLDGRAMLDEGPMNLRTTVVREEVSPSEVLDERVCDCCATTAAVVGGEPLVVFRDRSQTEVRDIAIVRREAGQWSPTTPVASDEWVIPGCPVNGPAAAIAGEDLFVAWFTAASDEPRVKAAISRDGGTSFGEPILIDADNPVGRVDLASAGEGVAVVSWLASGSDKARVMLGFLSSAGNLERTFVVAETHNARASGFPRLERIEEQLFLIWVDVAEGKRSHLRVAEIPLTLLLGQGTEAPAS